MKNLLTCFLAFCFSLTQILDAQTRCSHGAFDLGITSAEHPLNDPLTYSDADIVVGIGLEGYHDVDLQSPQLTQYYHTGAEPLIIDINNSTLIAHLDSGISDSIFLMLHCSHSSLPYYPVKATVRFPLEQYGQELPIMEEVSFYVWFTPWNTVEVWNATDYSSIKRQWLTPLKGADDPPRIDIDPAFLPVSNVPDQPLDDEEWWYYEPNLHFVDGLAYAIPVMRDNASEVENQNQTDRADGCGIGKQRFKYKLEGNLASLYEEENFYQQLELPLSDLYMQLYESDVSEGFTLFDQYFGDVTTDANGDFELTFNVCQSTLFEGDEIELYLKIYAYDDDAKIYGKKGNGLSSIGNAVYKEVVQLGSFETLGTTQGTIDEDILLDQGVHLSVVQARKAVDFCDEENVAVGGNINVWSDGHITNNFTNSAAYIPQVLSLQYITGNPGGRNTIVLQATDEGVENTMWHEFGHHVMYVLQDENYLDFLVTTLSHSVTQNNNPKIAWTEGWASAFGFACDFRNYEMDQEARYDGIWEIEKRNYRSSNYMSGAPLDNGFKAEFHFASAVYDLFESSTKAGSYNIPSGYMNYDDTGHSHYYNAWGNCDEDEEEYSLLDLCEPISSHNTSNDLIRNMHHYLEEFSSSLTTSNKLEAYEIFRENRICYDDQDKKQGSSADVIGIKKNVTHNVIPQIVPVWVGNPILVSEEVFINMPIEVSDVFNLNSGLESPVANVLEDVYVDADGKLLLNHNSQGQGGMISDQSLAINTGSNFVSPYSIYVDYDSKISIGAHSPSLYASELVVGEDVQSKANLYVQDESRIDIGKNDKMIVSSGSIVRFFSGSELNLTDNAELIIEDGAEVHFLNGSTLNASLTSKVHISSDLEVDKIEPQLFLHEGSQVGVLGQDCYEFELDALTDKCEIDISGSGGYYIPECGNVYAGDDILFPTECTVTLQGTSNLGYTWGLTFDWYRFVGNNNYAYEGSGQNISVTVWETTVFKLVVTDPYGNVYEDFMSVHKTYDPHCIPNEHSRSANFIDNLTGFANPTTGPLTIEFDVLQTTDVSLLVYGSDGILVETIIDAIEYTLGAYTKSHDISSYQTGLTYYFVLSAGDEVLQTDIVKL